VLDPPLARIRPLNRDPAQPFYSIRPAGARGVSRAREATKRAQQCWTAGPAARIKLTADREAIAAGGHDRAHLTVQVIDAEGYPVLTADSLITLDMQGSRRIIGVGNGNPVSHEPFQSDQRRALEEK
jgi:beta-galactosidase